MQITRPGNVTMVYMDVEIIPSYPCAQKLSSFIGSHQLGPYYFYSLFMYFPTDKMGKLRIKWIIINLNFYTMIDIKIYIMGRYIPVEHSRE